VVETIEAKRVAEKMKAGEIHKNPTRSVVQKLIDFRSMWVDTYQRDVGIKGIVFGPDLYLWVTHPGSNGKPHHVDVADDLDLLGEVDIAFLRYDAEKTVPRYRPARFWTNNKAMTAPFATSLPLPLVEEKTIQEGKKGEYLPDDQVKPRTLRDRKYDSSPERVKARMARNRARLAAIRDGRVKKGDKTKDVDHIVPLSQDGSEDKENLRVICAKRNRSMGGKLGAARLAQLRKKADRALHEEIADFIKNPSSLRMFLNKATTQGSDCWGQCVSLACFGRWRSQTLPRQRYQGIAPKGIAE